VAAGLGDRLAFGYRGGKPLVMVHVIATRRRRRRRRRLPAIMR
jgi:hypothetical protein